MSEQSLQYLTSEEANRKLFMRFEDACRLCLDESALKLGDSALLTIGSILYSCTSLKVSSEDGLPGLICNPCYVQLLGFYNFKKRCLQSDVVLRKHLVDMKLKPDKPKILNESSVQCSTDFLKIKNEENHNYTINNIDSSKSLEMKLSENHSHIALINEKKKKLSRKVKSKLQNQYQINDYSCDLCQKSHNNNAELDKHLKTCNITKSNNIIINANKEIYTDKLMLINTHFSEDNNTDADEPSQKKNHQCEYCGHVFKQKSVLIQHSISHNSKKSYSCELCPKKFFRKSYLNVHLRIHTQTKPYICDICGRGFRKSGDLCRHKRVHSDLRNYSCIVCGRKFKRSNDVITHMRTHTGERPYLCKTCNKSYTSHSGMQKHCKRLNH